MASGSGSSRAYDVYLSFGGGKDPHIDGFPNLLYDALTDAGIRAFMKDEQLRSGEEISPEIKQVVEHSKISILLLSKGYVSSKWCLMDLALIMECCSNSNTRSRKQQQQRVIPIFYDVDPHQVQNRCWIYNGALHGHVAKYGRQTVEIWRAALEKARQLNGLDINVDADGSAAVLIEMVVAEVKRVLNSPESDVVPDFEVFLNFRRKDSPGHFGDFLCQALTDAGIRVFAENQHLQVGEETISQVNKAISQVKISIPIFCQNYASNRWCLEELAMIMKLRMEKNQIVLPVFYEVSPYQVRSKTGIYSRQVSQHERSFKLEIVEQWRKALSEVGMLKGWNVSLTNRRGKSLKVIVDKVLRELRGTDNLVVMGDTIVRENETIVSKVDYYPDERRNRSSYEECDVYLSFYKPDVLRSFVDYLYEAMTDAGIRVFEGSDIEQHQTVEQILLQNQEVIKHSKICIPIFSQNYASSKRCLGELALMMEGWRTKGSHQLVIPIFYDINQFKVRNQMGSYHNAFQRHYKSMDHDPGTIRRWRHALTEVGELKGCDLEADGHGSAAKLLKMVVGEVKQVLKGSINVVADFEVFLNFDGPDTQGGFAGFLYQALTDAGIRVFKKTDHLQVGKEMGPQIWGVISQAKISIPIFSTNYASNGWCLEELTMIMEIWRIKNQRVLPIFYDVTPREFRRKEGRYRQIQSIPSYLRRVEQWLDALSNVGMLKGWDMTINGYQRQLIKLIVAEVLRILKGSRSDLVSYDHLVGIDVRFDSIIEKLDFDANDVRMVGIYGIGGSGKTTLANVVYNRVSDQFGGRCFLENVRDASSRHGLKHLRSRLFADILGNDYQGLGELQRYLQNKKVLVVLDDVVDANQVAELVGDLSWFGSGSRIIVTTRKKAVWRNVERVYEYEVKELDQHDAFMLFCKNAFQQDSPPDKLVALSHSIVEATGGLPLSVETIGSHLFLANDSVWRKALGMLKEEPGIKNRLMISYNDLDDIQKQMFLDMACFFVGLDVRIPAHMWRHCNIYSETGTEVLSLMSLVKIGGDNKIWVHDQYRDLARKIVKQGQFKEPRNRSRFWGKDAMKLINNREGTGVVEGISLDYVKGSRPYVISGDKFEGLENLRYLDLANAIIDRDFQGQLSNLRWLGWHGLTEFCLLPSLDMKKLVVLDLSRSSINETWNGWGLLKEARSLEVVDLTGCHQLTRTPDFSSFWSMERLILRDCIHLEVIDSSVGDLTNLISLDVRNCQKLKSLPEELGSLGQLNELLLDETSIAEIPNMSNLTELEIFSAKSCKSLSGIPESFESLVKLRKLLLDNCDSLVEIPKTIGKLESLQELSLSHTRVMDLPDPVGECRKLEVLNIDHCPIRSLPSSLGDLTELEVMNISGCLNLKEVPFSLQHLTTLKILRLDHTAISTLPEAIGELPHLHTLDLEGCTKIQSLPNLPVSLVSLKVAFMTSSLTVPNLPDLVKLKYLELQRYIPKHPTKDQAPSSSSYDDPIQLEYEYEVFLSFRGPDTRKNFTSILHTMLTSEGIKTFIDSEDLHIGEKIEKLIEAINKSKISIPVFSKGYAYSKWCLREAAEIFKCMTAKKQQVYPIFYDVDPSEVRNQTGEYAKAFRGHVNSKKLDDDVIQGWRNALREIASLKGLHLKISPNRSCEYDLFSCCCPLRCLLIGQQEEQSSVGAELREFISYVSNKLEKVPVLDVGEDLVGIEDHIVEVTRKFDEDINHVKMLAIWGMAGIGKTTIAKSIYNQLATRFKYHSFLENVRGTSLESRSLVSLQKQLVFDITRQEEKFGSSAAGKSALRTSLKGKKVLILVDDVDTAEQLNYLVGGRDWFSSGSIIIVTTREAHVVLQESKFDWIDYEVKPMHQQSAFLLFCKRAFRQDFPLGKFHNLSWDIVEATGWHPLAIQTVGSSLYLVENEAVWEEARFILRTKKEIHDKLKITYDALSSEQQRIFLDIACLFKGADKRLAVQMWRAQELLPETSLRVLLQRSLIKIRDGNKLWMHDLFVELGQEIVRRESNYTVWNQTRLWNTKDAMKVVKAKMGSEKVKAVHLDCGAELESRFSQENFEKLPNLEFLRLVDANFDASSNFEGRLSSLIWLSWEGHQQLDVPSGLHLTNLVILDLSKSMIKHDWNGWSTIKEAVILKVLNLSSCHQLTKTPDLSSFSHLERLILEGCQGLDEIDPSIGDLKSLGTLDARNCPMLKKLPKEAFGRLVAITEILLDGSSIEELPISSEMKKLETVSAKSCGSLTMIPAAVGELESLKELNLSRTAVVYLPDSIGNLMNLKVLNIDHCLIRELPQSLWELMQLEVINASGCRNLKGDIPSDLGSLKMLKVLRLDRTGVTSIPESITELSLLRILDLKDCMKLRSLPSLPPNLTELKVTLASSVIEPNLQDLVNLKELEIVFCGELFRVPLDLHKFSKIEKLAITKRLTRGL